MKDKRPVNLNISTIYFPPSAIASILHRVSGVILFVGTALLLWLLSASLESEESFNALRESAASPFFKFVIWAVLVALLYHLLAGCRHLLMDMGIAEGRDQSQVSAQVTIVMSVILAVLIGVWLW